MQAVVPTPEDFQAQQKIEAEIAEKVEMAEQTQSKKDEPVQLTEVPIIDFQVFFDASDKEAYQREC